MIRTLKKLIAKTRFYQTIKQKGSVEAYDIWSENYDAQPGNLMLDMDEQLFSKLLAQTTLKDKRIADIGCGTGRHWSKLMSGQPAQLTGFDVSAGMLARLKQKYPQALTYQIRDNLFADVADASFDLIVSTLTVAHIQNIQEALASWCRMLKPDGELIITDFHPNALAHGGKRTFTDRGRQIAVRNFIHFVYDIEEILLQYNFRVIRKEERIVDDTVKHYYTAQNALHVFEQFNGSRIIYGLYLKGKR